MSQFRSDSRLGRALRKARQNAKLTQAALAAAADCTARSVWQAERGQGNATVYLRLLAALDMEIMGRSLPPGRGLGDRLRALRMRVNGTVREVAAAAGVSPNTVAAVERDELGHLAAIERIADILGAGLALAPAGQAPAFYTAAGLSSAHDVWSTPPDLLERLYDIIGGDFDVDPCSPGPLRSRVRATRHLTEADDGLKHAWYGRVFMNPPYGRRIAAWTTKARVEAEAGRVEFVIGLVPARTDTRWWHTDVAGHADTWLLKGRLAFGAGGAPAPFPSAIVLWGAAQAVADGLSQAFPGSQYVPGSQHRSGLERTYGAILGRAGA